MIDRVRKLKDTVIDEYVAAADQRLWSKQRYGSKERWTHPLRDEVVLVDWVDGAREYAGFTVDIEQDGTDERPHVKVANGFLPSRTDAYMLADHYMTTGEVIPALRQEHWLEENKEEYDFQVIDP